MPLGTAVWAPRDKRQSERVPRAPRGPVAARKQPRLELSLHRKYRLPPCCRGSGLLTVPSTVPRPLPALERHLKGTQKSHKTACAIPEPWLWSLAVWVSISSCFPASFFGRGSLLLTHPSPLQGGAFPSGAVLASGTHGSLKPLDLFVSRQVSLHPTKDGRLFLVWRLKFLPDRLHLKPSSSNLTS